MCITMYPKTDVNIPIIRQPTINGSHIFENESEIHSVLNVNSLYSGLVPRIIFPNTYAKYIIGGIVIGFDTQTPKRDKAKFALNHIEHKAAGIIWNGMGIHPQNKPIAVAEQKDFLLNSHNSLCRSG